MLKIPGLTPLEQFRLRVADKPEIIEQEIAPGIVCFSVMKGIGNSDTYSDAWSREARGITFASMDAGFRPGQIISRPLHKFFNLNEREETLAHRLDWSKVVRVMDKRDGSMIHSVISGLRQELRFKSKKVFDSDVAIAAGKFVEQNVSYQSFCKQLHAGTGATPIFEWTSPNNRIVIGYESAQLKLLHIRDNVSGKYWSYDRLKRVADYYNIPLVDEVNEFNSFEELVEAAKTRENTEGWVIQFEDGEMVKVKTEWYMKRHRAMTFFRERDIAVLLLDEELDDVKAMLAGDGIDITPILNVETKFANDMRSIIDGVDLIYRAHKDMSAKDTAAVLKGHPLFGLVMSKHNGKQPNYRQYFEKHYLKQNYGLDTLGSLTKLKGEENEEG